MKGQVISELSIRHLKVTTDRDPNSENSIYKSGMFLLDVM